ncbi:toprim domain-containing protein [Skermania sp. ID1734]|uniref:toprim domain-containing protein n=1 Tax=Skermania sp. ID1734 TaxID=2597516 RepID=UPI00163DBECC|nr:toprim domain-containing protein [Skermania sp. ID1734]
MGLKVVDLFDEPMRREAPLSASERAVRKRAGERARAEAEQRREATRADMARRRAELERQRGDQLGEPEFVRAYLYERADGTPAGSVVRYVTHYEHLDVKTFRQFRWDKTRKRYAPQGFDPVLYHLPEVRAAVEARTTIVLVEGEKDADRARALGATATCNAMGAGSFTQAHVDQLAGAERVVIVTDRDEPGYRHAQTVREMLSGAVGAVYVVQALTGKDLSDHLDAGHPFEDLEPVDPEAELAAKRVCTVKDVMRATSPHARPQPPTHPPPPTAMSATAAQVASRSPAQEKDEVAR